MINKNNLQTMKYRPDIDGLRALAVFFVIAYHAAPSIFSGGFIGVDVFFVLSGYLISSIIFMELDKGVFNFYNFYYRRIKRILPALVLIIFFCLFFGWYLLFSDEFSRLGKHVGYSGLFISNFLLYGEAGYFDLAADTKPLLHLWSLAVEEQFYLIWPILLYFFYKKINLLIIVFLVAILSFSLNLYFYKSDLLASFYLPWSRFWELMMGSTLAWLNLNNSSYLNKFLQKLDKFLNFIVCRKSYKSDGLVLSNVTSFVGFTLLFFSFFCIDKKMQYPGYWALVPTLAAFLIIGAGKNAFGNLVISNKIITWFGLISYPLYLWHWPILSFARIVQSETPIWWIKVLAIFLSIVLAWLTYRFIELPIRYNNKYKFKTAYFLILLILILSMSGFIVHHLKGIEERRGIKTYESILRTDFYVSKDDDDCKIYMQGNYPHYCRFNIVGKGENIIAIVGDSTGLAIFPSMAKQLEIQNISTIFLGISGCPPISLYEPYKGYEFCSGPAKLILNYLLRNSKVKKVFIMMRDDSYYSTGISFGGPDKRKVREHIDWTALQKSLQNSILELNKEGKEIYFIYGIPVNPVDDIRICIGRPLRPTSKECDNISADNILRYEKNHRILIESLNGITKIDAHSLFCDDKFCKLIQNDKLLYSDWVHLSIDGGKFLVNNLLQKHLFQ